MKYEKHITRQMLQNNRDTLFVFGDNMIGQGFGGQAKEIRGERNAVGIPTKNYPGIKKGDYFCDNDYAVATAKIATAFRQLFAHAQSNGQVIWPYDGVGTGLADLQNKAPKIWAFIEENKKLLEEFSRR